MSAIHLKQKPASMAQKQAHARTLAYLGAPDRILAALANEFGQDAKLPSIAFIEMVLMERANQRVLSISYLNREPTRPRDRRKYGERS